MGRTFVSALDWGLGHTTRIIPIIKELLDNGDEVIIGASEKQRTLYTEFFPGLKILMLPSIAPKYSKGSSQTFSIILFLPRFIYSTIKEHLMLKRIVKKYSIQKVISDNRYGLYSQSVHSIFISHQLNIQLPFRSKILQAFLNWLTCKAINQFNECWVPDYAPPKSLTGKLTTLNSQLNIPIIYKGLLSRFSLIQSEEVLNIPDLLVIISGPERQRTVFENAIISSIGKLKEPLNYLIIRGLPLEKENVIPNTINHCSSGQLKSYIQKAKYIICRSGYSSIMDLVYLSRPAMLVPTPGQTEQEYLANYLSERNKFLMTEQHSINIQEIIELLQ